jgi:DeoR family fructose operon transcriptional repressor
MLTEERYDKILAYLKSHDLATVPQLMELLGISESTLRRDLIALEQSGKCRRVRGGVTSLKKTGSRDSLMEHRRSSHSLQKMQIGKKAAKLVEEGDVIYIDAGTTTEAMLNYLDTPNIRVITNSINHAMLLAQKNIPVTLTGGEFKSLTNALIGEEALQFLTKYNFNKGFFGTNAIDETGRLLTPDVREAAVKAKAMPMF